MFVLVRARVCGSRAFSLGRPFGCSPHQIGSRQMLRKVAATPRWLPASLYLPKLGPQNQARSLQPRGPWFSNKPRRFALSVAPRPPVFPPAAPRAPWPSPLSGVAFRPVRLIPCGGGSLGGKPVSAPFGFRAVCPRFRLVAPSPGVIRRGNRPAAGKMVGQPPEAALRLSGAASMMLFFVRVKGVAGRGRCFAPLTRFMSEKNVEMTWKGTKVLSWS